MSRRHAPPQLLSLNVLERPALCRNLAQEQLHPESPIAIKKNLGLDELDQKLFPTLVTGVRWWPFLCLAMDCTTEDDYQRVFRVSRRLKKALGRIDTARMGPETKASLRPYRSMARNIQDDADSRELYQFLQKQRFDGEPSFFTNYRHEETWQRVFLEANGAPARGYIRAHQAVAKQDTDKPPVERVITHILGRAPGKYDSVLWQGAFSFALLRCLFGRFDQDQNEAMSHDHVLEWKDALTRILDNPPPQLVSGARNPAYRRLLDKIENEESPPPLASQTKQFRREDRPVLASLRIPMFHQLYFKPKPAPMER